ncbi:MAG: hypothetical protein ISR65_16750 [Bacteriovoracaceae bacterium]|nr:hypothetical protein [Bacteriovoracaceae bacterium]
MKFILTRKHLVFFITLLTTQIVYGSTTQRQDLVIPFPSLSGRFLVGHQKMTFRDTSRTEVLAPSDEELACAFGDESKKIPVSFYYPVSTNATAVPDQYLPHPVIEALQLDTSLVNMAKRSLRDQKVNKGQYPLIIFSPGLGISSLFYTATLEEIASHGYIIAAISHPYISGEVYIPDTQCVVSMPPLPTDRWELLELLGNMIHENLKDIDYLLEVISQMSHGNSFLNQKVDLSKLILMGHSGGGMTATMYCSKPQADCFAAINFDGGSLQGQGVEVPGAWPSSNKVGLPFLKFHSASFPGQDNIPYERMGKKQHVIDVRRIDHKTFSDMAFFPGFIPKTNFELLHSTMSHNIITKNTLAFLKAALIESEQVFWPKLDHNTSLNYSIISGGL